MPRLSQPSDSDALIAEPETFQDVEREFPGWHVWKGVNQLWYARLPVHRLPWSLSAEKIFKTCEKGSFLPSGSVTTG